MRNHHERIQFKKWIAILGVLLLAILLMYRVWIVPIPGPGQGSFDPHMSAMRKLCNVWLIEIREDNILIYRDGKEERYNLGTVDGALYKPDRGIREQLADVILDDDQVVKVEPITQRLHGIILSADENTIEVEGYGRLPIASDCRGYRLYDSLTMCTYKDLAFGYDFADLVMQDGEVCGILMVRKESMKDIRVLIKTSGFAALLHEELKFTCDTDFEILFLAGRERKIQKEAAGEEVTVCFDSERFGGIYADSERIVIRPGALTGRIWLKNINRSQGPAGYRGQMELIREKHGFVVVNEVSVEDYLCAVVPSEMPSSYGMEALKAQAICARTYAYGHIQHAAYPVYGAHVDDSSAYQVYNNILEQKSTSEAVRETNGVLLETEWGEPAQTFYYSTSCGVGSDENIWKTGTAGGIDYIKSKSVSKSTVGTANGEFSSGNEAIGEMDEMEEKGMRIANEALDERNESGESDIGEALRSEETFREYIEKTNPDDFEAGEGWYRWTYQVKELSQEKIYQVLKARYKANPKLILTKEKKDYVSMEPKAFQNVKNLYIAARESGGVADELIIETDSNTYKVITEYNIRCVLCDGETMVKKADGESVMMPDLLPSGFFVLDAVQKGSDVVGYNLTGGGFGHGVGMSQNAAKSMALAGYSCEEILTFFFDGCKLVELYSCGQ